MGTNYTVIPVDGRVSEWLVENEIEPPDRASRYPTLDELRGVLANLPYGVVWSTDSLGATAEISDSAGNSTLLRVKGGDSEERDSPCEFYFAKGPQTLVHRVVAAVAARVGPFVICPDDGSRMDVIR